VFVVDIVCDLVSDVDVLVVFVCINEFELFDVCGIVLFFGVVEVFVVLFFGCVVVVMLCIDVFAVVWMVVMWLDVLLVLVVVDYVYCGKFDFEFFLLGVECFGVDLEYCLVVEDVLSGFRVVCVVGMVMFVVMIMMLCYELRVDVVVGIFVDVVLIL